MHSAQRFMNNAGGTSNMTMKKNRIWRIWAKALGEKASECDRESDVIALIRTFIFCTYLTTNIFIIANAIRHWNDKEDLSNRPQTIRVSTNCKESVKK